MRYQSIFQLENELKAQGYTTDFNCNHQDTGYLSCLRDSEGRQLDSCEECKGYSIIHPKRYMVETVNRGVLYFDKLPKGTYFQGGFQDINDKGKAMYYTWDNGTCLIPIIDTLTGLQVLDINKAGLSIND